MGDKETVIVWVFDGVRADLPVAIAWDILCEEKAVKPILRFRSHGEGNPPEILLIYNHPTFNSINTQSKHPKEHIRECGFQEVEVKIDS